MDEIKKQDTSREQQISEIVSELADNNGKKADLINKRIDFDKRTYKRLETMIPIYKDEIGENVSLGEVMSHVIKKAIDKLFEEDFKKKILEDL
ncbi:hypothetical protein [Nitrosophilus labii]|uniref:hypothetical protein n=1 Tax=Nitrosophilus labii TaxID=2706014 RepID=UPI001656C7D0|nr:hypothetical protein [Nitrosophilus labii]